MLVHAAGIGALHGGQGAAVERIRAALRASPVRPRRPTCVRDDRASAPTGGRKAASAWCCRAPYIVGSVMLWIAYFMGLVIFYALINWMPILLEGRRARARDGDADLRAVPARRRGRGPVRRADGPLQREPYHRDRLCADGGRRVSVSARPGNVGALVVVVFVAGMLMNTAAIVDACAGGARSTRRRVARRAWRGCWESAASAASRARSSWPN